MSDQMKEYRDHLVLSEQEAQRNFDKTVFTLSGGAIGVSFAFITDIVTSESLVSIPCLIMAWSSWAASLLCVLSSYYFSHMALRETIKQIDLKKIHTEQPGGIFDKITAFLNAAGAIMFIVGLVTMIIFVNKNIGG